MKETNQLRNLMESIDSMQEADTEVKGQGTRALRNVLADFGYVPLGSVYSDKRAAGRRVKATPITVNPKSTGSRYLHPKKMPDQAAVEASVAKHFAGMDVVKVAVHASDPKKWNDRNYIAVAYK